MTVTAEMMIKDILGAPDYRIMPEGSYCPINRTRRIYFIQAATGEIKIGVSQTAKIKNKVRQMQIYCPSKMTLLLCINEDICGQEFELHRMFKADRIHGEWFKPSESLLNFINSQKRK